MFPSHDHNGDTYNSKGDIVNIADVLSTSEVVQYSAKLTGNQTISGFQLGKTMYVYNPSSTNEVTVIIGGIETIIAPGREIRFPYTDFVVVEIQSPGADDYYVTILGVELEEDQYIKAWHDKLNALKANKDKKLTIAVYGDSITTGAFATDRVEQGYVGIIRNKFEELFEDVGVGVQSTVRNHGAYC